MLGTDAQTVGWGDVMQLAGPLGSPIANYLYYDKSLHPSGEASENYWGDAELNPVNVSFDKGDGVALDNMNALTFKIVNSGEVAKGDIRFAATENLNWIGNPFPCAININAIQLDDGFLGTDAQTVGWGDVMQFAGPLGSPIANYLYYDKSLHPSGEATENYWGDAELNPVDITLQPGDGFAIDNMNSLMFDIIITPPYSL